MTNNLIAREYFGITGNSNLVLHHVDKTLRYENPDRYNEWRPEDLVVVTKSEHVAIHNHDKHTIKSGEDNAYRKWAIQNPEKHHEYQSKRVSNRNKTLWKDSEYRTKMNDIMHSSLRIKVIHIPTSTEYESIREAERQTGISRYKIKTSNDFLILKGGEKAHD